MHITSQVKGLIVTSARHRKPDVERKRWVCAQAMSINHVYWIKSTKKEQSRNVMLLNFKMSESANLIYCGLPR